MHRQRRRITKWVRRSPRRAALRRSRRPEIRQPRPVGAVVVVAAAVAAVDEEERPNCTAPAAGPRTACIAPRTRKDVDVDLRRRQQRQLPDPPESSKTGEQREVNPYPRIFSGEPSKCRERALAMEHAADLLRRVDPNVLYTTVAARLEDDRRRGRPWDEDQRRSHPSRSEDDGAIGWTDHRRHERPRDLRDGVSRSGRARPTSTVLWAGSDDGRVQRHPRRRSDLGECDPGEMPEFGGSSQHRRPRRSTPAPLTWPSQEAAAGRPGSLHLPDP